MDYAYYVHWSDCVGGVWQDRDSDFFALARDPSGNTGLNYSEAFTLATCVLIGLPSGGHVQIMRSDCAADGPVIVADSFDAWRGWNT